MANPTVIKFSGVEGDMIPVVEDVDRVHHLVTESNGTTIRLTGINDKPVFVNPERIACWFEALKAPSRQKSYFGDGPAAD